MEETSCPTCEKDISKHSDWEIHLCIKKLIKVVTNPVAYASVKKRSCPNCKKDIYDHNEEQVVECLNKVIKQVTDKSD